MDFHSLTRRELQALCKKNKIPANLTNVAMANALQSLDFVEGIEELLKPCKSETANSSMESPGKSETVTSVPRTGRRTTQQKTIKTDSETLQNSTRSRCRTRGTVVRDVDESKNDMLETPALPTTRRRAAATSVQAKLESMMKECEPKEKTGVQIEGEKKDAPKTPAAALTSQRKQVKAKSSVTHVCSTRRSARLAGKPMQESRTQEDEKSGIIPFDVFPEETDESLELDSEHSVHTDELLEKDGKDLKTSDSLEINNKSVTLSGQNSNILGENEKEIRDVVHDEINNDLVVVASDTKPESGSEEVKLGYNINEPEDVHLSENKVVESVKEMASGGTQCLEDVSEANKEIAGEEESIEEPEVDHADTNVGYAADALEAAKEELMEESEVENAEAKDCAADDLEIAGKEEPMEESEVDHVESAVDSVAHGLKVAGEEEPMEEYDVNHAEANVDSAADALEFAGEEEPVEESGVDHAEANVDSAAAALEFAGEEEPMEESGVDRAEANVDSAEANVDSAADALEFSGEEEPMEESGVDHAEANVDSAAYHAEVNVDSAAYHALEFAGEEEPTEESGVDHAEANVDSAAYHAFPTLASLIPNASQESGVDHAEANVDSAADALEFAGEEEPIEESRVDHAEANVDSAAYHALPPLASLIPNASQEDALIPNASQEDGCEVKARGSHSHVSDVNIEVPGEEPMEESEIDYTEATVDSALPPLASVIPSALTSVKSSSKKPLEKSSAATNIGQMHISDDKENIGNCGKNLVLTKEKLKKNKDIAGNDNKQCLEDLSLRKLTKMLKELQITNEIAKFKAPSSRSALQTLPQNRLNGETEN